MQRIRMPRSDSFWEQPAVALGLFRLFPTERLLEKDGVPVRSLRLRVRALRKALGDEESGARYVKNVPGPRLLPAVPVSLIARWGAPSSIGQESGSAHELTPALTMPLHSQRTE